MSADCQLRPFQIKIRSFPRDKPVSVDGDIATKLKHLLFEDLKYADITLKCSDGVELKCHSNVLSVDYPEMYEMLQGAKVIQISDINSKIMREVLRWIYCKKITDITSDFALLVKVANAYHITDLKEKCFNSLQDRLNPANIKSVLKLAAFYKDSALKSMAISYVKFEYEEVSKHPSYQEIDGETLREIIDSLVKSSFDIHFA